MSHLSPEQLVDVAEETRPRGDFPHLSSCAACQCQIMELRDAMAAAAGVELPQPSPLFWEHFSARVREAVATEEITGAPGWWMRWAAWRVAATAAAVAVLAVMISTLSRDDAANERAGAGAAVEFTPIDDLVPFEADPALAALAELSAELDWDAASEAGLVPARGTVDRVVLALEDEERLALQRIIEEALKGSGV